MSNIPLEFATNIDDFTELAIEACGNAMPGFQFGQSLVNQNGMLALLEKLETIQLDFFEERVDFNSFDKSTFRDNGWPHIDGSFMGLAVHRNYRDFGNVQLAHLLSPPPFRNEPIPFHEYGDPLEGLFPNNPALGPIHVGGLEPNRYTVFTEGYVGNMLPTVHLFSRTSGYTGFERYSSIKDANSLSPLAKDLLRKDALSKAGLWLPASAATTTAPTAGRASTKAT